MRLTRQEIYIVLFILAALVLGTAVKHWRQRNPSFPPAASTVER